MSKIIGKEKAEEKYTDAIAKGNTGIISSYNEKSNSYKISIGNLLPNKTLELKCYFTQFLTTNDMCLCYTIMDDFPQIQYQKKLLKANIEINTLSKITRLITRNLNPNESYSREFSDNFTKCNIIYEKKDNLKYDIPFSITFRTENSNEINLYSQYNKEKNETSYILSYLYSKNNSFKINYNSDLPDERNNILYSELAHKSEINSNPGLFIFLIDQSASMGGNPIKLVCESLLIFLQSLPKDSYYQLIGFGSSFEKYNNKPVLYSRENINETFNLIKKIYADKGGTNISQPLKNIFVNSIDDYKNIHLPRNIFLLTDGEVSDSKQCFELISKNNNLFRIQSIGIGNSFDKKLIETCGRLGKGSYNFVSDINQINNVVIQTLNNCMNNYYIDPIFKCENKVKFECQPINDIIYEDEIIMFSFISEGNKNEDIEINFKIKDNESEMEENLYFNKENIHKLNDGDSLGKIIMGTILKYNNNINEEEEKKLAKEYQVLSKNSTLYAEFENEENSNLEMKSNNQLIKDTYYDTSNINLAYKNYSNNISYNVRATADDLLCLASIKSSIKNDYKFDDILSVQSEKMDMCKLDFSVKSCPKKGASGFGFFNFFKWNSSDSNKNVKKINNYNKKELREEKVESVKKQFNLNDMILTQDIIDGCWNENEKTKFIISKYQKIYNLVEKYLKGINIKEYKKMSVTFIVLYYLRKEESNKIQSYMIIINKAELFLSKNGISYNEILSNNKI